MNRIIAYWAHDPVGNNEGIITNYDTATLKQAEANGIIIIAEHEDGTREKVNAEDVTEPNIQDSGIFAFVTPQYVDDRTAAAYEAIKSIADAVTPMIPTTLAADGQPTPLDLIRTNLNKLKTLTEAKDDTNGNS
ncbi:hypothetical protein [Bifidobacterium pullorum]|uniref:hypothetical protein n=1 Tax=Bifidobacterium pullorum TaxID=78448 RepID=UPI003207BA9F